MTEVNSKKESSSTKTIPFVQKSSFSPAISQIKHHRQSQKKKRMSQIKIYSPDYIQSLLEKTKGTRTKIEIRILTEYLSNKYDYFKKLRSQDNLKCERLISVLNIERFKADVPIINYGEEGDKFYIVFDGLVGVYKPIYNEKIMSVNDYYLYMRNIKYQENNLLKLRRVIEKNSHLNLDLDVLEEMDQDSYYMRKKHTFLIEENDKLGEFGSGFAFGEIALIKRTKRNATIIASNDSILLSIEKYDYNKIIREMEEKRLEKVLEEFKRSYPIFQYWTLNHLIKLMNCFSHHVISQGEYLYRQDEDSDHIYIIRSGTFEMYSLLSFGWINDYYSYIKDAKQNLIYLLENRKITKESDLHDLINEAKVNAMKSPCKYTSANVNSIITSMEEKENVFKIKKDEESLNNPYHLFKIKIKHINYKDVIGIEDSVEMKKRFCFVKCTSSHGDVDRVNLYDFIKLMNLSPEQNNKRALMDIIAEKKAWLLRTVKNAVKNTAGYIERKFDNRYDKLLNEKENDTKNKLVALKLRAWGSDIGDIAGRQCLTQRQSRSDVLLSQSNDTQSLSKRHHQVKSIKIENKYMSPINIRKTNTKLLLKTASSFTNPNHFNHTKSILFSSLTERGHSKQRTVNTFASTIASPIKPIKFAKLRSISSSKEKKESKEKSSIETMISSKVFLLGCDFNNRYKQNLCKFGY